MAAGSTIEWCDDTFNPWWGCVKVSAGCANCYAETLSRVRRKRDIWGPNKNRKLNTSVWRDPIKWNREAERVGVRRRVFCMSMGDLFENRPDLIESRSRTFDLVEQTPWLDWLLLTKRPENMLTMVPDSWCEGWPDNAMALTSIEDQKTVDVRLPLLLQVPARRGLSAEPLIEEISSLNLEGISWVIVGGESGSNARLLHPDWARSILRQCQAAGVAYFFKQHGEWIHESQLDDNPKALGKMAKAERSDWDDATVSYRVGKKTAGGTLDGRIWHELPDGMQAFCRSSRSKMEQAETITGRSGDHAQE